MGLLDFLFGVKKSSSSRDPRSDGKHHDDLEFLGNIVEIPSLNFLGRYSKSPSGEWVICWSDADANGSVGGHRHSGHGRYVLYNLPRRVIEVVGTAERPNACSVADNGNFSLEEWHFGSGLCGTFCIFSSQGESLIKKRFNANLYNSAISDSGRLAICQTANNPDEEDGNRLTAFHVENRLELFSVTPVTGWADSYTFLEEASQFGVVVNQVGMFYYDEDGNFADREKFDAARLQCSRYDVVLLAAEQIIKSSVLTEHLANQALEAATRALSLGAAENDRWKAIALKIQGLAHERLSNDQAAIAAFNAALSIDPKIGVKRKVDALKKKLVQK